MTAIAAFTVSRCQVGLKPAPSPLGRRAPFGCRVGGARSPRPTTALVNVLTAWWCAVSDLHVVDLRPVRGHVRAIDYWVPICICGWSSPFKYIEKDAAYKEASVHLAVVSL
jgi:hypothetical protein